MGSKSPRATNVLSRKIYQQPVAAGAAIVLLVVVCGFPLLATTEQMVQAWIARSLHPEPLAMAMTLPWGLLGHSLGISSAITVASLLIGVPLGVLLGRFDVLGRRWALWLHTLPLFLPPFLLALGWHRIWGNQGLAGSPWTSDLLFGELGLIGSMTMGLTPVVSLLTLWGVRGIDPALEEAAQITESPFKVMLGIALPLARSNIWFGALCVFGLSLSETGAPLFLRVHSYAGALMSHLAAVQYAPGNAMLLVLPILGVALLLTVAEHLGAAPNTSPMQRRAAPPLYGLPVYQRAINCGVWLVVLLGLMPLAGLAYETTGQAFLQAVSGSGRSLATSLVSGLLATGGIAIVGGLVGHAGARGSRTARWAHGAMDRLALFTFFTPGSLLGVGLISVWNRPTLLWLYDSIGILSIGLAAHFAIVGLRISHAIIARSPPDEEEAAICAGASYFSRLASILLPLHGRVWGGSMLLILLFCLRDLSTNGANYPPGYQSLTVRLFSLEANASSSLLSALSLFQVLITAVILFAGVQLLLPRQLK